MDRLPQRPEPAAIDITWVSCRGVRSSLPFHTPCLYASVCVASSAGKKRPHRVRTPTDRAGGENPEWDERLRLHLHDDASSPASEQEAAGNMHADDDDGVLVVRFELKAEVAVLGDVLAASAVVPLPDLVADGRTRRMSYQLSAPSDIRQPNGVISFSYVFHDGSNDERDHDEDRWSNREPVAPPCPAIPLTPVSSGMYPVIDDWPSMEQLAPLMQQTAVYPPPLTADTVTVTGSRYYYASTPPETPVHPAAIYPPPTRELSPYGIYPTVGEPDSGLYPTVDLAPISCYPPTMAPCYGRGFEYPAAPDWGTEAVNRPTLDGLLSPARRERRFVRPPAAPTSPPRIRVIPRLRRPLRRREVGESPDPGVYIV